MNKILAALSCLTILACCDKRPSMDSSYQMLNYTDKVEITLTLEGNRYSGKSAINRYFGRFEKDGHHIKFGPAGATMMAGPENLMKIEQKYLESLAKVDSYALKGKTLILSGPNNIALLFEKQ